jgi:hypothetical protein
MTTKTSRRQRRRAKARVARRRRMMQEARALNLVSINSRYGSKVAFVADVAFCR